MEGVKLAAWMERQEREVLLPLDLRVARRLNIRRVCVEYPVQRERC